MMTGLVWDERYMWYEFGSCANALSSHEFIQPGTPIESPESKRRIINLLSSLGLLDQLKLITPDAASEQELSLVHDPDYVAEVKRLSDGVGGFAGPGAPLPKGGYAIAALAAGGWCENSNRAGFQWCCKQCICTCQATRTSRRTQTRHVTLRV